MKLEIEKKVACRIGRIRLEKLLQQTIKNFGKKYKNHLAETKELSLALVDENEIKKLNKVYRNKNKATDVLSFDYGEIIICIPVAKQQAESHKVSVNSEIELLFVHGLLHVLGFDHEKPKDNKTMRDAEQKILGYNGLINLSQNV
jgi:probable rRNA maturation factor